MQFPEKINHSSIFAGAETFNIYVFLSISFLFLAHVNLFANADSTGVKKINGILFVVHKVDPGQGLYGVARRYKTTVPEIQKANQGIGQSLSIGQIILVPCVGKPDHSSLVEKNKSLPKTAEIQKPKKAIESDVNTITASSDKEPIYHTVTQKETLNAIAVNHHLTVEQLKGLNHSKTIYLTLGGKMIVGYKEKKATTEKTKSAQKINPKPTQNSKSKTVKNPVHEPVEAVPALDNGARKPVTENGMGVWVDDGSIKSVISLAMHKTAPAGTIIKITNPMNGRAKYVKVVGSLPDTDDNKSIIIKISKSTADDLGIIDKDFRVKLEYSMTDTAGH